MEFGGERERKERSTTSSPRCTHTDNEGDDDQECLFDFGRERSTTRIGGQQLHLHESPTKDNRRNKRKDWRKGWNERENEEEEREGKRRGKREEKRQETRQETRETRERGLAGPALLTVAAATSLAAETNQRPSREVRSSRPTPLSRTGLHSVRAHHTEPRKTCSRVRGICNSAIMKREFVQPCARQNSEFTDASGSSKPELQQRRQLERANVRQKNPSPQTLRSSKIRELLVVPTHSTARSCRSMSSYGRVLAASSRVLAARSEPGYFFRSNFCRFRSKFA